MEFQDKIKAIQENIQKVIIGKPGAVRLSLVALLARGHLLIEDVPGVGKTTLAHALARSLGGTFQRIQFTSDLLPSDILGVSIYDQRMGEFQFKPGPIFANVVLADEINRTTPKTQSSLLEAMNDFQVSIDHRTYKLPQPFIVLATQNPLEYHGTHPLPESQMDRFLLRIRIGYPQESDEKRILQGEPSLVEELGPVISSEEVLGLQQQVEKVRVDGDLVDYIMSIVQATRRSDALALGVSPRGSLALYRAAQALALLDGRHYCVPDDVKFLAIPALAHRIIAVSRWKLGEGRTGDEEEILRGILEEIPVPR